MTTPPVVSITDDLIAELEAAANACESWYVEQDLGITLDLVSDEDNRFVLAANPAIILALLAERADLNRQLAAASVDAERYRFIRGIGGPIYVREIEYYNGNPCGAHNVQNGNLDAAIDAARNIAGGD